MYGSSIKCDVCVNVEFMYQTDEPPQGWIRLSVNQPKAWPWNKNAAPDRSSMDSSADCCSIDCARSILNEAYDAIPLKEKSS